jgi:hypothetical protein
MYILEIRTFLGVIPLNMGTSRESSTKEAIPNWKLNSENQHAFNGI